MIRCNKYKENAGEKQTNSDKKVGSPFGEPT